MTFPSMTLANAIEAARHATAEVEIWQKHRAAMEVIETKLPAPGAGNRESADGNGLESRPEADHE